MPFLFFFCWEIKYVILNDYEYIIKTQREKRKNEKHSKKSKNQQKWSYEGN